MIKGPDKNEYDLLPWFDRFIHDSKSGKRSQKNGKRLRIGSVNNYQFVRKILVEFIHLKQFPLRLKGIQRMNGRELHAEKSYWKKFYRRFTDFLYQDKRYFDNYVGQTMKILRCFFNYLNNEKNLMIGNFHNSFYVCHENIPIVVLHPDQLHFLISNKEFENSLSPALQRTKDIFVFGCTVALRVSDLLNLRPGNLERIEQRYYLRTLSMKTHAQCRVLLPDYALAIVRKYRGRYKTLLPEISNGQLNRNIKKLIEKAGWKDPVIRTRERRGNRIELYKQKEKEKKKQYQFYDQISSHTMRRTAITTMLSLGMPEHLVRQISGHSPGSKEFYKYVQLSQSYIDSEMTRVFQRLEKSIQEIPETA